MLELLSLCYMKSLGFLCGKVIILIKKEVVGQNYGIIVLIRERKSFWGGMKTIDYFCKAGKTKRKMYSA